MLKSYREKAEVIRMFSFVNLSEQNNSHLIVEGTMSYNFWRKYSEKDTLNKPEYG